MSIHFTHILCEKYITPLKLKYVNPSSAKLYTCNLNFYSLEVASRCRNPQLQVDEKYLDKLCTISNNTYAKLENLILMCPSNFVVLKKHRESENSHSTSRVNYHFVKWK